VGLGLGDAAVGIGNGLVSVASGIVGPVAPDGETAGSSEREQAASARVRSTMRGRRRRTRACYRCPAA
jgi:hypothetical protein